MDKNINNNSMASLVKKNSHHTPQCCGIARHTYLRYHAAQRPGDPPLLTHLKKFTTKLRSVIYRTYESDTECFIELRHIDNFCFLCHWPTKYQKGLKTGENIIKMNKQIWKNNERPHTHTHTHTQTNIHTQTLTSHTPHTSSRHKP